MSRSFMKLLLSLFLVIGLANVSFAQDEANMARPNTKAGSAAWVFEFGGLSTLGINSIYLAGFDIQGNETSTHLSSNVYGAGWKYYISDDMAIRAILGFNTSSSGNADSTGGKNSRTAFGIQAGIEMHTHAVYSTSPYFGAAITYALASVDQNVTALGEDKTSASTFGIAVLAGFDWYFTRGIAVGGEYSLGFSTSSSSTVATPKTGSATTHDNPSITNIGIGAGSVHLVVHF